MEKARASLRAGRAVKLENLKPESQITHYREHRRPTSPSRSCCCPASAWAHQGPGYLPRSL